MKILRLIVVPIALLLCLENGWTQSKQLESRIERLEPIQQHQLKALMESRANSNEALPISEEEVRKVRESILPTAKPLDQKEIEQLSLRINKVYGLRGSQLDRIVSENPVFPVCTECVGGLDASCHDGNVKSRRVIASELLTQHPNLAKAVGGLFLVMTDGSSQLIGTAFVLQNRIVTNVHVMFDLTKSVTSANARMLKPGLRVEAQFGVGKVGRISLPIDAIWSRHPSEDLIWTDWPKGGGAPIGLTLATDTIQVNTSVALLGFPSVNTNTDRSEDIAKTFGLCQKVLPKDPGMSISMGHVMSVTGATLEHDANTMGNSSGSPLIRISDGVLVGIHRGDALSSVRNSAIAASALTELSVTSTP